MKKEKVIIYKSKKNGQFGWKAIAKNGKKVACGGETFHNKKDCLKSIKLAMQILALVEVTDTTK